MQDDTPIWYHGTRRGFSPGGWVFPRSSHGGAGSSAPTTPGRESPAEAADFVYVTTDLTLAWAYAWAAPGRGKPKVLTVIPHGPTEPDPEHSSRMDAWRCEFAKVTHVDTDPILSDADARAGWVFRE